jgi:hypothetical protein
MWYSLQIADFDKANGRVIGNTIYKEAPTLFEAMAEARYELRLKGFDVSIAGRKVIGEEWDCDSWNIAGHIPHGRGH